jgi:hypothetical protein
VIAHVWIATQDDSCLSLSVKKRSLLTNNLKEVNLMVKFRSVIVAFILGVILSAFVTGAFLPASQAQQNTPQLPAQLEVYTYPTGLTGFYDRGTGMLYLYDTDLNKCVVIRKLEQLGEPLRKLRDPGR